MLPDSYFAGHFDGEGCIRMSQHHKGWRMTASVKVSHKATILQYQERFVGAVRARPDANTNKLLWEWYLITHSGLLEFIDYITPFSQEKLEQLELAKRWLEQRKLESLRHPSDSFRLFGEECAIKLSSLKKVC